MSFPFKLLLAVVVWLAFYLLTFRGCQEELCLACDPVPESVSATDTVQPAETLPLYFKWSDAQAYVGTGIEALVQQTLQQGDSAQFLQITGLYYEGEPVPEGVENMGLARAAEVARLFDGRLDSTRIQLRARQVEPPADAKTTPSESVLFDWLDLDASSTLDRLSDRVAIRFPPGSAAREYAPDVDTFLVELASQLKTTGQKIQVTGHTDNTGAAEQNLPLGLARAEAIKQILVNAGVEPAQVLTESKGSTLPVASNSTEEGRYQNRRVEIRYIQQN